MPFKSINEMLAIANKNKASDLHVTAKSQPKARIDGTLRSIGKTKLTQEDTERLILPMMEKHSREQLAETGQSDFSYTVPNLGRYRVNAFRQKGALACVCRVVDTVIPSAESLGIPPSIVELTKRKRGLVLVTGPTGSGKSTSLASLIDIINTTMNHHIITLEDPIEYLHEHKMSIVNQREIGFDTDSYGDALRAALREDPDIILLGEMRDLETIATAVTAAETGHLVFSTLHTTGAANTIDRIIDVFPPHQQQQIKVQLANVLVAVISQQLIPKEGGGRIAAFEVMHSNPAIANMIREGKTHQVNTIIQTSRKVGMITMDDALIELYRNKLISKDNMYEYAQDITNLKRKV